MTREKYAEIDDAIRATLEATTAYDHSRAALGAIMRARGVA
jgi:hypothetical protein